MAPGEQTTAAPPPPATPPEPPDARLRSSAVELGLTAALLLLSVVYLARFLWAVATEPLWGDEIWAVLNFSSQGPRASLTEVNNAVLPTFISSLLPGADSLDPLRARFLSMLAVVALPVLAGYELFRRRWFLPGALFIFLFTVNYQWLDRTLQARGYGILGLCAAATSFWLWRHLEEDDDRWLWAVGAATLAGTWTVPSFAFFAVPLWLLVLVTRRRVKLLLVALATGLAVLAVYAPLLTQLADQTAGYSEAFGEQFRSPVAIAKTVGIYLLDLDRNPVLLVVWALAAIAPALVLLPGRTDGRLASIRRRLAVDAPQPIRQLVRILAGASAGVFVIALALRTPPTRTVAFVVVPIALATIVALATLRDDPRLGRWVSGFLVVAAVLACIHGVAAQRSFTYLAIQEWDGAAELIDDTFPDGMPVFALTHPEWLGAYLDTSAHPIERELDTGQLRDGALVVSAFDSTGRRTELDQRIRATTPDLVQLEVEQRGQGDRGYGWPDPPLPFPILVAPPLDTHVAAVTVDGKDAPELLDRRLDTGVATAPQRDLERPVELVVRPAPGTDARSLVLAVEPGRFPRDLEVEVATPDGRRTLPSGAIRTSPEAVVVDLGDEAVNEVVLTVPRSSASQPFHPVEVWIYPP